MSSTGLASCHECDLLQRPSSPPPGGTARCRRCNAELYRNLPDSMDRSLAYALAALVFFAIANAFPILGLKVSGNIVQTTLFGAVRLLYLDGMWPIAALVLITTQLMPLVRILAVLYLLLPLRVRRVPPRPHLAFRILQSSRPWSMTEVLTLGILVALVKLVHLASVVPGIGLWTLGAAMVFIVAMALAFDPDDAWARIAAMRQAGRQDRPASGAGLVAAAAPAGETGVAAPTAAAAGLFVCHECGLLSRPSPGAHDGDCPRCGARVHFRKPASIARTWALLLAAIVLYVPANVLPVMYTSSLFGAQNDTIMSGVVYLWVSGSWPLAIIVFIASIAVPMLKILALGFLAVTVQFRWWRMPLRCTRIYRVLEVVGPWSMLDIYVIAILVALVQFSALATIKAGPAAIAFGAVVVLTMLAAHAFDPRLLWDRTENVHA
ncbi:paraquat-inducible membrane protein A [Bordetella genomosp. 8]|uniref:Paraquat-inducible membrane protein A n=1 Tax=Bordetella genomosp. 8 TaxID=1416806 RepID=A0A1W6YQ91_9BORD|nr:paraquat-inducible protein A [Bordetella genomosp. 8]ARP83276.1 paraquat-inducible membrane protein A [Bordetella genomosp. 8]